MPKPVCPPIAADVIAEVGDAIVFIERKNIPHGWAFLGGFVEFGETVEAAAIREAREDFARSGIACAARRLFAARP